MKRVLWPLVVLLLITLIVIMAGCDSFTTPVRTTTGSTASSQNTGIWVTGEGKVAVVPDMAVLNVGVEAQADTVAEAMAKASAGMASVGAALTDHGIESKDIQTHYFSIQQRTKWDNVTDEEVVTGYRVTNKMTVKIRVLSVESVTLDYKAGNIIDTVVKAGGDLIRIDSFSFTVDDPAPHQKEAREKALDDAEEKAEQIADKAGLKLGDPTYINETSSYYPYSVSTTYGLEAAIEGGTSISSGETTITVYVQVAYAIK